MYQVSRKLFMDIVKLCEQPAVDGVTIAESVCELIETDVNENNRPAPVQQIQQTGFVSKQLDAWQQVQAQNPETAAQIESAEEKKKRIAIMVKNGMGQVDKNGNFTPFGRQMNLGQDARERW